MGFRIEPTIAESRHLPHRVHARTSRAENVTAIVVADEDRFVRSDIQLIQHVLKNLPARFADTQLAGIDARRKRMDQAEARLRDAQRQAAGEHQEEAIRRLQQAKADLEEILRQLREEEIGRTLAMLETRFRKMLDLQQEVYDGTVRLDAVPQPQRTAGHPIEASRLGGQERQIVAEADKALALLREDGGAASFGEATEQMRDDMQQIAERLARARVGRLTQDIEQDVLAALREMLDALAKAQKDLAAKKTPAGKPSSVEMVEPPLVDRLSELRMIRALQMRVNRRTDQYAKRIDGPQATDPDLREALGRLAERQRQIHRVTRELETGGNP